MTDTPMLEFQGLSVRYALKSPLLHRLSGHGRREVRAVDGIDLTVDRGEVLGVIGESGSGKSTLGRTAVGLAPITEGAVRVNGVDIASRSARQMRELATSIQMVFQDPHASMNPTMTVGEAIADPLRIHRPKLGARERERLVEEALVRVGLEPAGEFAAKRPADLSGGQKQRAVIARAIVLSPSVIIADEPVSALDMSVRAKVLSLMSDLRAELDLAFVYITHDLASAKFFCDSIAIMYLGRIVEYGPVDEVFAAPQHPYTRALLEAIPDVTRPGDSRRPVLGGEVADAVAPPRGCSFHPRCPVATAGCGWEPRDLAAQLDRFWTSLSPKEFAELHPVIGAVVADLNDPLVARMTPGRNSTPARVADLLERMRSESSDALIWSAISHVEIVPDAVRVRLAPSISIPTVLVGNTRVACVHPANMQAEQRGASS